MKRLPRADADAGWTVDPDLLIKVSDEVTAQGWDTCIEIVEIAMLAAERNLAELNSI